MSLPKVSLLLKRPAEAPAPAPDRRVKPRAAPPPSEDLEAAKALSGLFAAAPAATSACTTFKQSDLVLHMVRATARPPNPRRVRPPPRARSILSPN